jgi:hypothetical protein
MGSVPPCRRACGHGAVTTPRAHTHVGWHGPCRVLAHEAEGHVPISGPVLCGLFSNFFDFVYSIKILRKFVYISKIHRK